jgi:hypothetical protein
MQMIRLLTFIVAAILAAAIGAELVLLCLYWGEITKITNYDKVGPLISALFAPLVSILTIAVSYLVLNRQFRLNEEIEKIRQRLGERYKRESDAYFKVWESVSAAYRTLGELETGRRRDDLKQKTEDAFTAAEPYSFVFPQELEDLFYGYWQTVRELVAEAQGARSVEEIRAVWVNGVRKLNEKRSAIREQFRNKYLGDED